MIAEGLIKILLELKKEQPLNQRTISKRVHAYPSRTSSNIKQLLDLKFIKEIVLKEQGKHYLLTDTGQKVASLIRELEELLR